jgi:anti-sigma factor ChrR (cupin superfamily)
VSHRDARRLSAGRGGRIVAAVHQGNEDHLAMTGSSKGRRVVDTRNVPFLPYDLDGPLQPEMGWLPISFDRATGQGCYLMRMRPGAVTIAHDHPGVEDFLMLEGELVDSDGTVFRAGDFVSYEAGTQHNSWTTTGCLIAVFEWRRPAPPSP